MSSTLSTTAGLWAAESPTDPDRFPNKLPSLRRRASRSIARFLIAFFIGVVATLAWQSFGDTARAMIASSSPLLSWLAPQAASAAQSAPADSSRDQEQFKAMLFGLAGVRQRIDQIAAQIADGQQQITRGQERTTSDIIKLQAIEQDILDQISAHAPQPAPVAAPARKPAPPASQPLAR
jgi:hypothetical protein